MIYLKAVILAIVEGVTEFLPISSTGHLILVDAALSLSDDASFNTAFMLIIQLPAILAVMVYFWADLWPFTGDRAARRERFALWGVILLALLPSALAGILAKSYIDRYLLAPIPVSVALFAGGVVLIGVERIAHRPTVDSARDIGVKMAILIGLFQCLALIPGTSRAAATIVGAMLLGATRSAAAKFSFYLAIPTMAGVAVAMLFQRGLAFTGVQWAALGLGSAVSFLVAYGVIAGFMTFIRRRSFAIFGWYRIVLALGVFVALWLGWLR